MPNNKPKDRFYYNLDFLSSPDARSIRIMTEFYGPFHLFRKSHVADTIVFFGSARLQSRDEAQSAIDKAPKNISKKKREQLNRALEMSRYYEDARTLAKKMTVWSKGLKLKHKRFIIASGGGPGIMEAANRGASEAKGISVGLTISLPHEESGNPWISEELDIKFHYFFMRKFWFLYLAKALVVFPGGFGTLDELMELLTLIQTGKIIKKIPIVLYDSTFWNNVVNWDYLVEAGTISKSDLSLFETCDTVDKAYKYLTKHITKHQLKGPNF